MQHNGWDHALKVTADGTGLVGHAGAVLLRKAADQAGLTAQLSAALRKKGSSPVFDRGTVLVSLAAAIALGATSMSDIALLAHLAPVLGDAPSGPTVRRALDLAGTPAALDKIARARAKARAHAWTLIEGTPAGFPWLEIAGKTLTGWLVIDMDATLVTASSDKEGAAPDLEEGLRLPPARRLAREHPRVPGHAAAARQRRLEHVHRPQGGAGRGPAAGPGPVPAQDPRPRRRGRRQPRPHRPPAVPVLPAQDRAVHLRVDDHRRRRGRHPAGPGGAWKPGTAQDGSAEDDKDVAEITGLMSRAGNWPDGLRWIARRVKPSRRHLRNLTDYEKKTGWKYSITCTNIPDTGIAGVPGSHHPQYIDTVHREHAVVETGGVRTAKAMGLRNLPSKTWQVNAGWVIAANIAADLAAWTRLLGCHDDPELRDADPDTLRYRIWHIPARLARHARERILKISPDWPWKEAFLTCWQRLCALPAPA